MPQSMERVLKWLDDCDDLLVVWHVQRPVVVVGGLLFLAVVLGVGSFLSAGIADSLINR
jgi:hypothetical protein